MAQDRVVLILEDEFLIAMDLDEIIFKAGHGNAVVFSSCVEAVRWLDGHSPTVAVIDIELRDGNTEGIARLLADRGIPFVVHSGRSLPADVDGSLFLTHRWINKPSEPASILTALDECLANRAR